MHQGYNILYQKMGLHNINIGAISEEIHVSDTKKKHTLTLLCKSIASSLRLEFNMEFG